MNKNEVIDKMAELTGYKKSEVSETLESLLFVISESLAKREAVSFYGFGKFEAKERPPRTARNMLTNELIELPKRVVPVFRAGKDLKRKTERGE